jgi:MFS family permease
LKLSRDLTSLLLFRVARSVSAGMISLTFPYLILRSLRYPPVVLGLVYTGATIATAVLGLTFGYLADSWSRKRALVIAGLLLPLSSLLVCLSGKLPVIVAAAMLGGYSASGSLAGGGVGGAARPIQSAALAELTTVHARTATFSLFTFAGGLFAALGALLSRVFTVYQVFLVAALVGLAGVACLIPARLKPASAPARELPSRRVIGKFTITGALNGFAQGLVTPFLIPFFILVYDVPKWRMSTYGFVSGALGACAILAAPALERRWGFVRSIAITRGLGAILLACMPLSPLFALALAIYFITPALRVSAVPVQQTAVTELVSETEVGRALGINQVARLAASSGATALTGYLFHVHQIGLPFYLYGGLMMLNVFLYFRFFGAGLPRE